jgi:hypothetical protein
VVAERYADVIAELYNPPAAEVHLECTTAAADDIHQSKGGTAHGLLRAA